MSGKVVISHSSYLVTWPVMGALTVLGVLSAFFGYGMLSAVLILLAILVLLARLWAGASSRNLALFTDCPRWGLFPGETLKLRLSVTNGKLLPVLWMELFLPLPDAMPMVPEQTRTPDDSEKTFLKEQGFSTGIVGSCHLPGLLWNETRSTEIHWEARRRGIYHTDHWQLRTGDGFGLCQVEVPVFQSRDARFAVFPRQIPVRIDPFLQNQYQSDIGTRGMMEDVTVIRSVRDYTPADNARRINWRLSARGLPLSVNVFETILPRSIHFLLDSAAFLDREDALEDSLSVLGSLFTALSDRGISCGLSIPGTEDTPPVTLLPGSESEALLWALAAYTHPGPETQCAFDLAPLWSRSSTIGRFYFLTYSSTRLPQGLEPGNTAILSCVEGLQSPFQTIYLPTLKEDSHGT